jgi:hypothetical protein
MSPPLALVILDPTLFVYLVVLLLHQLLLWHRDFPKVKLLIVLELLKTLIAPVVLIVRTNVVLTVPTDSLERTINAIAVIDWRFK